jgi:hypothetical protein
MNIPYLCGLSTSVGARVLAPSPDQMAPRTWALRVPRYHKLYFGRVTLVLHSPKLSNATHVACRHATCGRTVCSISDAAHRPQADACGHSGMGIFSETCRRSVPRLVLTRPACASSFIAYFSLIFCRKYRRQRNVDIVSIVTTSQLPAVVPELHYLLRHYCQHCQLN